MRNLLFLILFLTGCSTAKPKSEFMTVNMMHCDQLENLYFTKQLSKMPDYEKTFVECGVNYKNVRIKKSLIRSLAPMGSVATSKIDPMGDLESPLKIDRVNVMYCQINNDRTTVNVQQSCEEVEAKLNE